MASLYRKFRPDSFSSVIGQEHVTQTLINQLQTGRIGHAYLFTGSRGVGKTTCARIFARAINCLSPIDGSPCGKCEACRALSVPNMDILEIDAASNNGVDDAREIREKVNYPPVHGKYKVYIIDEVHMLTGNAFNALLKTLEEPPSHAVFILATTEAHKLPATILSRCMRFDFRLVSVEEISALLCKVYDAEGKRYDLDAIKCIAAAAEGSVRDSLSIADMCISFSGEKLTYEQVLLSLGGVDKSKIRGLFSAIASADCGKCFDAINELAISGKSMGLIAKELTFYARDLLLLKTAPRLVVETDEHIAMMKEDVAASTTDFLTTVVTLFSSIEAELRYSLSPRIVLETACLRACKLAITDLAALEERISRLEKKVAQGVVATEARAEAPTAPTIGIRMTAPMAWGKVISYFRMNESARLQTLVGNHSDVEVKGNDFIIWCGENYLEFCNQSTLDALGRAFAANGIGYKIKVDKRAEADKDKELERLKQMVGRDVKINVVK
ncbi:MAG: DNA polymerase III subunit gamma/tau [Clostridia bacterium]|nr:DNA polymerase III subunit gamma/tau [Clostridia bacterium]